MTCLFCSWWRGLFGYDVEPPKHKCLLKEDGAA